MHDRPIAIIGYAYRAPGIGRKGLGEYLADAKSAWSRVPADRFEQDAFYHPDAQKAGCFSSKGAHFLPDDVYAFDAPFFNLRPDEARAVDPHHRILLECAFEAAESSGLSMGDLAGANIGVFSAIGSSEYGQHMAEDVAATTTWAATGTAPCMFANRLSYFFDLAGPSIALDAACASSSYAVHLACQSLCAGECTAAFVGGSSLILGPNQWAMLDNMGALSSEGISFSYDAKASGFGRGEGAACLLVKRLEDAIRCGDPVHAIIRNSACSHSGRSEGITMPRRSAQEQLLWRVHQDVGLDPSETAVVEGHGTGTQAGDPIEAGALAMVLGSHRTPADPLYIGSLKSNFGHLEGTSGILGIIKAILMIQQGRVLPTAHFEKFNKNIEGRDKLKVAQIPMPWPPGAPRRVCVTNFGFGGSNAVTLLEEAPATPRTSRELTNGFQHANGTALANGFQHTNGTALANGFQHANGTALANGFQHTNGTALANGFQHTNGTALANGTTGTVANGIDHDTVRRLFVLSAKSESSLSSYLSSFTEYLDTAADSRNFLNDLSFTLCQRRTHHPYRVAATADSVAGLKAKLSTVKASRVRDRVVVFAFTGQGVQYAQMATGLRHYKLFASAIDQAEAHLDEMGASWSLIEELEKPESETRINDAEISQPVCTAVQLALVALLQSWGVNPAVVTGHSSGEIAAAFAAGLVSFRAAMALAYFRGQAAAQFVREHGQKGAMLALGTSSEEAWTLIQDHADGYATVAAINSSQSVTVSGDVSTIESIHRAADSRGLFARRLKVELAYHSRHMEKVAASYITAIKPFYNLPSESPSSSNDKARPLFVSSVTGRFESKDAIDASYWVKNLLQPVRFADAIESVFSQRNSEANPEMQNSRNIVVEVGSHSALKNAIKQTLEGIRERSDQRQAQQSSYLASLVRGTDDEEALLALAGSLFSIGYPLQLGAVNQTDHHNARVLDNLPPYAWDKSARYVHQSRVVREKLQPGHSYDPLLGWHRSSGAGGEHIFRQVFTLDEIPWVRDHFVAGQVVFPMTGYMSLAVEAVRRVSATVPAAILVRELHAKRSLGIEEDERVDITTKLRPAATGTENFSSTTWVFEIMTWSEAVGWTTHCYGQVEAETKEMTMDSPTFQASAPLIGREQLKERPPEQEYATQGHGGTIYGPAFRTMVKFWACPEWTVLQTELRDMDLSKPAPYGSLVSVDPPTLDSFLQGFGPLQEIDGKRPTQMPTYMSRLRISNHIPAEEKQRFTSVTRLLSYDTKAGILRISIATFTQSAGGDLVPVAEWETITLRSIASPDAEDSASSLPASYYWDLIPSLDLADSEALTKTLAVDPFDEDELLDQRRLNRVAVYYLDRALKETAGDDVSQRPPHLSRFVTWARAVVAREAVDVDVDGEPSSPLAQVPKSAQSEMLSAVGEQLVPILRGAVQPLEIMLKDGLLARNYEQDVVNMRVSRMLARYARHLSEVKADLRILEVGAGTGSTTLPVLEQLSGDTDELPPLISYTFTDISSGFFENARTKLSKWASRLTFKKLDISQEPQRQGFVLEDYDLVIASSVLHATPNMDVTMKHVRSLLRPDGRLLLVERIDHQPVVMPYALLPGWWLSEDGYRSPDEGPLLSLGSWHRLLSTQGFSGVDGAVASYPGHPDKMGCVIASTRIRHMADDENMARPFTICGPLMDAEEEEFAQMVADQVTERLGCAAEVQPLLEAGAADDQFCIFIDSPRHSVLRDLSPEAFDALKNVLLETRGVLWVIPEHHSPEASTIKGILRSLQLENESTGFFWLENVPCTSLGALNIAQLAQRLRVTEAASGVDQEFVWSTEGMHLRRFRPLTAAKEAFASEAGIRERKVQNIWQGDGSLEMTVEAVGSPDSIYFRRTDTTTQQLEDDEVLIQVEAAGVNFRDLLLILGSIPWTTPGFEGAGVVVRTGPGVSDLQPGERVYYATLAGGSFATHVRVPSWRVFKIPDGLSATDAASIPVAYATAVVAVLHVGRLRKGESILVHAGSGAVGQACIVLAQHVGARIFATAGSPAKREFLHETFGIPQAHIFNSRTPEFRDGILCATDGRGVDVVVNSLSGSLLQETWSLMANFGRFVEIGKRDLLQNSHLTMRPFDRNVTFSGVDLRAYFEQRPEELRDCLAEVMDLFHRGIIVPIRPVNTLPVSQFGVGLRKLQSGQNIGKIVLTMGPDECVLAESAPPPSLAVPPGHLLRADATYLITGGTGGIGLSLGSWMIENGARHVVLLGRSGSSRPEVQKLLLQYQRPDIHLRAIACDVGSRPELERALQSIQDLPPVRGVVHGALYLRDALFVNATYDDWQKITGPRVQGAQDLHELLPDLDFMVLLSSFLAATGNVGQSIYSGTSSFFDAFASYRNAQGLPAVSIALPVVLDVGYVADRNLTETLKTSLGATLTQAQLHTLVKGAIIGPSSSLNHNGNALSLTFVSGEDRITRPWQCFRPRSLVHLMKSQHTTAASDALGPYCAPARPNGLGHASTADLLDALISKVSSITMIDRDEVEPDAPLANYSLDSLVSVELRNWIRRETRVDLSLPKIVGAPNLRALATQIRSLRDK